MKVGQKLVIIAEKNLFDVARQEAAIAKNGGDYADIEELVVAALGLLHVVQLEIIETRKVEGDYTKKEHDGFRAIGSDGWHYHCQWDSFDEASSAPYQNWQREFIKGVHYTMALSEINQEEIDKFLIPEDEFFKHFLNWDAHTVLFRQLGPAVSAALLEKINKDFPTCAMFVCETTHTNRDGKVVDHRTFGAAYKHEGCLMCAWSTKTSKRK